MPLLRHFDQPRLVCYAHICYHASPAANNLQMSSGLHSVALTLLELGIAWPDYSDTTDISLGLSQAAGGSPVPSSDPLPRSAHHFVYVTSSFVRDHHASAQKRGARLQLSTWDFAANISVLSRSHRFLLSSPCFSLCCSLPLPVLSVATLSSLRPALQQHREASSVRHTDSRGPADANIPSGSAYFIGRAHRSTVCVLCSKSELIVKLCCRSPVKYKQDLMSTLPHGGRCDAGCLDPHAQHQTQS